MKNYEGWWRMNNEWWRMMISSCWGVLQTNEQTNRRTDICDCRVAFAIDKDKKSNIWLSLLNKQTGPAITDSQTIWNCLWNFELFAPRKLVKNNTTDSDQQQQASWSFILLWPFLEVSISPIILSFNKVVTIFTGIL